MLNVNETRLMGHLGRDPEIRTFPSGDRIANLSICTTEKWRDRSSGELKEFAEWHRVVVREPGTVEYLERNAFKGSPVYVEGSLRTRKVSYPNADDKYFTEVHANRVAVLHRAQREGAGYQQEGSPSDSPSANKPSSKPSANSRRIIFNRFL